MTSFIILAIENDSDRDFMENIYVNYYPVMRKRVFEILRKDDYVDDIINDACEKLISKIPLLRTFNSCILLSYIVYTVRNTAIDFIKHRNVESKWLFYGADYDTIESVPDNIKKPDELLLDKEKIEELYKAINKLPEEYKLILQYKYFFNMTDKEIAEIFEMKTDSVRAYLSRARKKVYKLLERESELYGIK